MKHFKRLDWLLTRFLGGAIMLHGFVSLSGFAFAQASGSDNATHFSYDNQAALDVKQVSVKVQDGVTVQDITYTGSNGDTVPAYLVVPQGRGKFAGVIWGHWIMPGAANANRSQRQQQLS
jgi:hypothetical protein